MRRPSLAVLVGVALVACQRGEPRPEKPPSASETAPTLVAIGARAPSLKVKAHTGQEFELAKLGKPAVVYFYPKDDTTGCTIEAKEIRDLYDEIKSAGAIVIGVSTDGQASHQAFAQKYELPFFLVADEDHSVAKAFGVAIKNGKAARVSFVLDANGRVTNVFPKVTPQGHGAELLAALGEGAAP